MRRDEHEAVEVGLPGGRCLSYDELSGLEEADAKIRLGADVYERAADDVRSRRAAWGLAERDDPVRRRRRTRDMEGVLGLLGMAVAASLWLLGVWATLALVTPVAVGLCIAGMRHRSVVHVRQAVRGRWCPRCDFDLSGSPSGLPAVAARGVDPGPSRCPECGLAWPLVPPRC